MPPCGRVQPAHPGEPVPVEYLVFFAAACGAPFVAAVALPGALLYALSRRGRPMLDLWGDETCGSCGYDLTGLASDCCPECGRPFRRIVECIEPPSGSPVLPAPDRTPTPESTTASAASGGREPTHTHPA